MKILQARKMNSYQVLCVSIYEGISNSFRTGQLERELRMVELCATTYSCVAIL
jgi:hypothetical protein